MFGFQGREKEINCFHNNPLNPKKKQIGEKKRKEKGLMGKEKGDEIPEV